MRLPPADYEQIDPFTNGLTPITVEDDVPVVKAATFRPKHDTATGTTRGSHEGLPAVMRDFYWDHKARRWKRVRPTT